MATTNKKGDIMKKPALILGIALLAGCAGEPTIDTSPDAEFSFDGLAPIANSRLGNAWVDPNVDLTQYNQIILGRADFEFRNVPQKRPSSAERLRGDGEYWISDENREKLIDNVTSVFREELENSEHFTITEERSENALIIVGAMHDIVSKVPPDRVGRSEVWLSSVGEATLVIEARDSLSGKTVYRAIDRRRAEQTGNTFIRSNSVTTWAEVRRLARSWATRLLEGLDSIHE